MTMRTSNSLLGLLNFLTFLLSIPILGGGIWLSNRASSTDCMRFLQWPLIIIGVCIMLVSLAGFVGACYRSTFLLRLYLFAMFFIIVALVGFIVFAFVVTAKGSGRSELNRAYRDYYLVDYSGWLEERVSGRYWRKISSCIRDSKVCKNMARGVGGVSESSDLFFLRTLKPIESGCCKPPTECGFAYVNETAWDTRAGYAGGNLDCTRWSNIQEQLCYGCDSCKAGVLASIRKSWRKVSMINIVVVAILVIVYLVGCVAFRNNKRIKNDEPYGENKMTKSHPSRFQF